jgi:hypothetical protein
VRKDRLLVGVLATAAVAAVATAALGFVLADLYRPQGQSSATWRDWHLAAGVLFLLASASAAVVGLVRRAVLAAVCALVATVAALATLLTSPIVAWDLVGVRSVTVVTDVSGYWPAALDDEVVLVINGATELSPGEYAVALAVHLGAPVLGAAALVLATVVAARSVRRVPRDDVTVAPAVA